MFARLNNFKSIAAITSVVALFATGVAHARIASQDYVHYVVGQAVESGEFLPLSGGTMTGTIIAPEDWEPVIDGERVVINSQGEIIFNAEGDTVIQPLGDILLNPGHGSNVVLDAGNTNVRIVGLADPEDDQDAVNLRTMQAAIENIDVGATGDFLPLSGGTLTGNIVMPESSRLQGQDAAVIFAPETVTVQGAGGYIFVDWSDVAMRGEEVRIRAQSSHIDVGEPISIQATEGATINMGEDINIQSSSDGTTHIVGGRNLVLEERYEVGNMISLNSGGNIVIASGNDTVVTSGLVVQGAVHVGADSGGVNMSNNRISQLAAPTADDHAVNRGYMRNARVMIPVGGPGEANTAAIWIE
ncbi:MAG: hypothetical protein FWC83_00075 [Alphaproteobacteria bacterium]|nr:hypothetical protein [Alphaproteobacteria bacterium]